MRSVLHVVAFPAWTSAPSLSTTAASPIAIAPLIASTALGGRWRPDEGIIYHDFLFEELQTVSISYGSLRFVEGGVLDQDVTLQTCY